MRRAIDNAAKFGTAVIGIAMLYWLMKPGNNTASIIMAAGESMSRSFRVLVSEMDIEERVTTPEAWDKIVSLAESEQLELYAGLSDADLDWVIDQLGVGDDPCAESCSNPAAHAEGGHDV